MLAMQRERECSGEETARGCDLHRKKVQSQQPEAGMDVDKHIAAGLRLFKTWVNVNERNKRQSLWLWCSCAHLWAGSVILLFYTLNEEKQLLSNNSQV